jgi:hypothetical protein
MACDCSFFAGATQCFAEVRFLVSTANYRWLVPPERTFLLLLLKRLEQLLQLRIRIVRILDRVTNRPLIAVDLIIITTLIRLITKEMNRLVIDAVLPLLLLRDKVQAVRLVPARGEDVEADLPADGVCEAVVRERLFQRAHHGGADVVLDVVLLVLVALLGGGVAADGRDVDHAVAELDEGAALDGDVEVGDVVQDPERNMLA